jgi:hypothetical protein
MNSTPATPVLPPEAQAFYRYALDLLNQSSIPFLLGGAYALASYTGIVRHTKDLDVFVRPADCRRVLDLFAAAGFRTELTFAHWLGKIYHHDHLIDVIFSSGNALVEVDDLWFQFAKESEVWGRPVRLCPPEEIIWSKGYIMERERFDGADIIHLLRACGPTLDWQRLLWRFGSDWRLLLSHLVLFGYVYPEERGQVAPEVMNELLRRLAEEQRTSPSADHVCQGTRISREQYLTDVTQWGYQDARLPPRGAMSPEEITRWTAAIAERERPAVGEQFER